MQLKQKIKLRDKRKNRVRKNVHGTAERLRLSVHFSSKHIYAQCVNDDTQCTVVFLSTLSKECGTKKLSANITGATLMGNLFGTKSIEAGVKRVVLDRSCHKYHGRIKAFADAARQSGLEF